jgi:hypothetical protein
MAESDALIGPDEIAYTLELTPAQLKVAYYALRSYRDDFGHEERDVLVVVNDVLAKFPDELSLRDIRITSA